MRNQKEAPWAAGQPISASEAVDASSVRAKRLKQEAFGSH